MRSRALSRLRRSQELGLEWDWSIRILCGSGGLDSGGSGGALWRGGRYADVRLDSRGRDGQLEEGLEEG